MRLFRSLFRLLLLAGVALVSLAIFLFAVVTVVALLFVRLLTGRRPNVKFRMDRNPWRVRKPQPPVSADVYDIEAREVKDAAPLPLQPPHP